MFSHLCIPLLYAFICTCTCRYFDAHIHMDAFRYFDAHIHMDAFMYSLFANGSSVVYSME